MTVSELYINDRLVDLPQDSVIALSFAVNTLYEVKTIQGNVSNRIVLPPTANNLEICGFAGDLNIDLKKTVRKRVTCRYIQNGVEVISVGYAQIDQINDAGISMLITSGNTDFFDLITGSIRDLNMAEFDHVWNKQTVIASRFNTAGYIYPVIDYGSLTIQSTEVNPKLLRPAVFLHTINKKIIEETGYTVVNLLETSPETAGIYNKIILPFSLSDFQHSKRYLDQFANEAVDVRHNTTVRYENNSQLLPFSTEVADALNLWNGTRFTAPRVMNVNIKATFPNIHVSKTWLAGRKGSSIELIKTVGATETLLTAISCPVAEGSSDNYPNQVITLQNIALNPGDRLHIRIVIKSQGDCVIEAGAKLTIETSTEKTIYGQTIQVEATLPDISKKDMLKFTSALFAAIVQTDNRNKTVRIVPFSTIKDNVPNHVDWSDKIVDKGSTGYLKIGDYAQKNVMAWKEDDAIVPDDYGSDVLPIADENLPLQKDLFDMPFSASLENVVLGGVQTIRIAKIEDVETGEFSRATEPRIAVINPTSMDLIYDDGTGNTTVTGNIPLAYFNSGGAVGKPDLMMSSVRARSYVDLEIVLNDQRRISCQVYLSELDIASLDFFIPVFIRKYGCYFYVASVANYVGDRPCKVELIKLF